MLGNIRTLVLLLISGKFLKAKNFQKLSGYRIFLIEDLNN